FRDGPRPGRIGLVPDRRSGGTTAGWDRARARPAGGTDQRRRRESPAQRGRERPAFPSPGGGLPGGSRAKRGPRPGGGGGGRLARTGARCPGGKAGAARFRRRDDRAAKTSRRGAAGRSHRRDPQSQKSEVCFAMKRQLIIVGAGGFGREVLAWVRQSTEA